VTLPNNNTATKRTWSLPITSTALPLEVGTARSKLLDRGLDLVDDDMPDVVHTNNATLSGSSLRNWAAWSNWTGILILYAPLKIAICMTQAATELSGAVAL
jgi:hypothetical protein